MKTILVVDDEVHVRRIVATRLEKNGYHAIMAESAEIALALAARTHIDLVITDNSMSGMSGIEMAKLLRSYPQHASVPVLMISSHQFEIGKGELAGTNIKHVEGKPFSMAMVLKQVEKLIGPATPPSENDPTPKIGDS